MIQMNSRTFLVRLDEFLTKQGIPVPPGTPTAFVDNGAMPQIEIDPGSMIIIRFEDVQDDEASALRVVR